MFSNMDFCLVNFQDFISLVLEKPFRNFALPDCNSKVQKLCFPFKNRIFNANLGDVKINVDVVIVLYLRFVFIN